MTFSILVLGLVSLQRIGELLLSARNTRRRLAEGAVEVGAGHYPLIVGLHAAWLGGLWLLAWNRPLNLAWLGAFLLLQGLRAWVIATLGPRWTTRIIVLPGERLVTAGPYRLVRHPNYWVVAGEIAALPLAFGLVAYAAAFSILNAAVLILRIRTEDAALGRSPHC